MTPYLADEWGEDKDTVHDYLKSRFLKYRKTIKTPDGDKDVELVGSTAQLNTQVFIEFNENVKRWAACNLDLYIPDPNEIDITDE